MSKVWKSFTNYCFVFYHQTLHTAQISIENATSFNIVNLVANVRPPTAANPHKSRKCLPRVFHTNFDMFKTTCFVAGIRLEGAHSTLRSMVSKQYEFQWFPLNRRPIRENKYAVSKVSRFLRMWLKLNNTAPLVALKGNG